MSSNTEIEWTDATWNPVRGCSIVSKGCMNCYAMRRAHRHNHQGGAYQGLTKMTKGGPVWTGKIRTVPELLDLPLRWKKPRRVFVNSMSDLFHEDLPLEFIDKVFAVMALAKQHTFQVLTKRPARMLEWFKRDRRRSSISECIAELYVDHPELAARWPFDLQRAVDVSRAWPPANVWLGVSVEDQARAEERIPLLLKTLAAVRWISAEPLLGPLDLRQYLDGEEENGIVLGRPMGTCIGWTPALDWVVVGGESGLGARDFDVDWARRILAQCKDAAVPCFIKQLGATPYVAEQSYGGSRTMTIGRKGLILRDRKGGVPAEWPTDIRVRQFPDSRQ